MSEQTRMQVRCDRDQKERWIEAAGGAGNLSEWIRDTLDREAAVEEGPDSKALGETPDEATAQVAPDGPSSTVCAKCGKKVYLDHDSAYWLHADVEATDKVNGLYCIPEAWKVGPNGRDPWRATVEEEHAGTNSGDPDPAPGEPGGSSSTAAVPAPIQAASLDIVVQRLFPDETTEGLMAEYESTDHDFNDFLGWLTWRHERDEEGGAAPENAPAPDVPPDVRAMLDQAKAAAYDDTPDHFEGNLAANIAGGYEPHVEPLGDTSSFLQPGEVPIPDAVDYRVGTATLHTQPYDFTHLDDDTNPEPEDPDDLGPRMLDGETAYGGGGRNNVILSVPGAENVGPAGDSADHLQATSPPAASALSPTCQNAVMHWQLTAGQTCRFCGGTL